MHAVSCGPARVLRLTCRHARSTVYLPRSAGALDDVYTDHLLLLAPLFAGRTHCWAGAQPAFTEGVQTLASVASGPTQQCSQEKILLEPSHQAGSSTCSSSEVYICTVWVTDQSYPPTPTDGTAESRFMRGMTSCWPMPTRRMLGSTHGPSQPMPTRPHLFNCRRLSGLRLRLMRYTRAHATAATHDMKLLHDEDSTLCPAGILGATACRRCRMGTR
jgi:hypothetical protein